MVGFGPFGLVLDNPASRLARELDRRRIGGTPLLGREMPVSYRRAPELTLRLASEAGCSRVLGIGVARGASEARVEAFGYNVVQGDDVDGVCPGRVEPGGPDRRALTGPSAAFASALGVPVSDDPGRYVCNAWAYVLAGAGLETMFLHIPDQGLRAERVAAGLDASWGP